MKGKVNIEHTVTLKTIFNEYQANRKCENVVKQFKTNKSANLLKLSDYTTKMLPNFEQ